MSSHILKLGLDSSVFSNGFPIPVDFTADGRNISPPLTWTDPPASTRSLAVVCEDVDVPNGPFTHWILFNLPPERRELQANVLPVPDLPDGSRQGVNDLQRVGYAGPSPPLGQMHRYRFRLYALASKLGLDARATREQLLEAMRDLKVAEGELLGVYERRRSE